MADIKPFLNKIKTAIYGKEVRGSIHDGIDAINKETEESTKITKETERRQGVVEQQFDDVLASWSDDTPSDNAETVSSRTNRETGKNYKTLGQRLDLENKKVTEQLSETTIHMNGQSATVLNRQPEFTVVIIDDDTRRELYDNFFPFLQRKNIPITAAAITSRIGNHNSHITLNEFNEMKNSGLVEFVNHTHDHVHLAELNTEQEIDYQIRKAEEWLRNHGVFTRHLVYPFGSFDERVRRIAAKYVDSGSRSGGDIFDPKHEILDSYRIRRISFEWEISDILEKIDEAKNKNGLLVINTHAHYETSVINKLEEIINYVESLGGVFKKFSEAYADFGNVLELREGERLLAGISATGYLGGLGKGYHLYRMGELGDDIYIDEPPTRYPQSQYSSTIITPGMSQRGGWPSPGTLTTSRHGNESYTFQELRPLNSMEVIRRYWDVEKNRWSEFESVAGFTIRRDVSTPEIPAKESRLINIESPIFEGGKSLIVNPDFNLPNGLTFDCRARNDVCSIRLINATDNTIKSVSGIWVIKIL